VGGGKRKPFSRSPQEKKGGAHLPSNWKRKKGEAGYTGKPGSVGQKKAAHLLSGRGADWRFDDNT